MEIWRVLPKLENIELVSLDFTAEYMLYKY